MAAARDFRCLGGQGLPFIDSCDKRNGKINIVAYCVSGPRAAGVTSCWCDPVEMRGLGPNQKAALCKPAGGVKNIQAQVFIKCNEAGHLRIYIEGSGAGGDFPRPQLLNTDLLW
jgi:hypothetical protein